MSSAIRRREFLWVALLATLTTFVFWSELWAGGGLVGGDIYSYFLPQKQLLRESLQSGTLPFWHNRTSFGYPLIAESQAGVFYPPNWVLYGLLDAHRGYHVGQLAHYVVAVMATWWLAREWGLSFGSAILAAVAFVYGWFPPRLCLEWAIVGGCYLPQALLCVERFVRTRRLASMLMLALLLGLQMTAGHFHLAFITQLTSVAYAALRLAMPRISSTTHDDQQMASPTESRSHRARAVVGVLLAVVAAFCLAAVQLGPSWELKQISQRQTTTSREFDPGYGHIPPLYLSQVVASWWWWYAEDVDRDRALTELTWGAIASGTNQVEAHLYFGLLPLALVTLALLRTATRCSMVDRGGWIWLLLGIAAVIYATGWLLPIARHLPGFSFFRGLGRFGIVTTLSMALLAGRACDLLWHDSAPRARGVVIGFLVLLTLADLHVVAQQVRYSIPVSTPPMALLEQSPVKTLLSQADSLVRLDAPGANLTNLLGVSAVPEYLGLGPVEYYETPTQARLLDTAHELARSVPLATRLPRYLDWAEHAGVTHVLLYEPIVTDGFDERIRLVFRGLDPFLNRAWARGPVAPIYLYELPQTQGRASVLPRHSAELHMATQTPNSVILDVTATQAVTVILRDLDYPGWRVVVDGAPAISERFPPYYRSVRVPAGNHHIVWTFRPTNFWQLTLLSISTLIVLVLLGVIGKTRRV